jgi:hypothetical protein
MAEKKRWKSLTAVTALIPLFLFSLMLENARACSCSGFGLENFQQTFDQSAAIFEGRAESMEVVARRLGLGSQPDLLHGIGLYRLKILKSYKGQTEGDIFIATGDGGGDCGVRFEIGTEYAVFADARNLYYRRPYLETNFCSGTDASYGAGVQIGLLRRQIYSRSDAIRLAGQLTSPLESDAAIKGRIRGTKGGSRNTIQILRSQNGHSAGIYVVMAIISQPFLIGYYPSGDRIENAAAVEVSSGQSLDGIDFEVAQPAQFTVTGKLSMPFWIKRPAEKILVCLEDREYMMHRPTRSAFCRSDGSFKIEKVHPGRYHVITDFRFEEKDPVREWKATVPVIQVPAQIEGVKIHITSAGGNPWKVATDWVSGFGLLIPLIIASALVIVSLVWTLVTKKWWFQH